MIRSATARRQTLYGTLLGLAWLALYPAGTFAGPPLVTDDPHTVGAGRVELIVALDALEQPPAVAVSAPVLDATLGLSRALDLTLVGSPVIEQGPDDSARTSGFLEVGAKWQLLRTAGWNASFSPAFELQTANPAPHAVVLPLQLEWRRGRASLGADVGYIAVARGADRWRAGGYASFQAAEPLVLLAEVWSAGVSSHDAHDVGAGLGLDWRTPLGFHLLTSAGTGLASRAAPRVDWTLFVGLQWNLEAWSPTGPRPR